MNTRETTLAFAYTDDEEVVTVDRSTLERYCSCPAQARYIESGRVLNESLLAAAGQAVHDAFKESVESYISEPDMPLGELVDRTFGSLRCARPDIQPEAIAAGRASVWAWAKMLTSHSPTNVIKFDGGQGERSGQLAWDLPMGNTILRITSELDLLLATPAKQVLREVDYKSGWKRHGIDSIASSFQFGLHAWLVFENYPEVQALEVQVWQTRTNNLTYPVTFDRSRLADLDIRIRSAAGEFVRWRNTKPQDAPTWPALDKCPSCPAAVVCPASLHVGELNGLIPGVLVDRMVAVQATLDALEALAIAHVKETGKDLVSPSGAAFGFDKPIKSRRTKALYSIQHQPVDDDC
jgi:hypothetical protein